MIDAAITLALVFLAFVTLALAADVYGAWRDRRDDGLDTVRRRDERLRALERTWGRRGR